MTWVRSTDVLFKSIKSYCLLFRSEEWPSAKSTSWASSSGKPSQNQTSRNPRVRSAQHQRGALVSISSRVYIRQASVCQRCSSSPGLLLVMSDAHAGMHIVLHAGWIGSRLVLKCSPGPGLSDLKCVLPWWWEDRFCEITIKSWRWKEKSLSLTHTHVVSPTLVLCPISVLWITFF